MQIERHPFEPFLPEGAVVLFLGSFPPQPKRWSMEFYYPNWLNDFWRVCGIVFFKDRDHFVVPGEKRFDVERVKAFCTEKGMALFDTATAVRRLQDNASDKFLEFLPVRQSSRPAKKPPASSWKSTVATHLRLGKVRRFPSMDGCSVSSGCPPLPALIRSRWRRKRPPMRRCSGP